jgi:single-strand DNA-binding protein
MSNLNKLCVIGRLGHDPEVRSMPSGDAVVNVSIATTETWTDKQSGEKKESTTWLRAAFFGRLAEIAEQYLRKGSLVYIEGPVSVRAYVNRENEAAASLEVRVRELKMLSSRNQEEAPKDPTSKAAAAAPKSPPTPAPAAAPDEELDDEIPF